MNLSLVLVRLHDRARDPPALGDLVAVLARPLADGLILIPAGPATGRRGTPARPAYVGTAAAHAGGHRQVRVERLTKFAGVLFGQVNGVGDTVKSELDGAVGLSAVEVIGKKSNYLLGHDVLAPTTVSLCDGYPHAESMP